MSFKELDLPNIIRTGSEWTPKKFFKKVLAETKFYRRAAGYFSSSVLLDLSDEIMQVYNRGGKIQLVISPNISKEDLLAIKTAEELKNKIINEIDVEELIENFSQSQKEKFNFLLFLIKEDILEIKLAVRITEKGLGLYHEKLCIFEDEEGNIVSTIGSNNASENGLIGNFESAQLSKSYDSKNCACIEDHIKIYNDLWNNNTNELVVFDIPEKIKDELFEETYDEDLAKNYIREYLEKEAIEQIKPPDLEDDPNIISEDLPEYLFSDYGIPKFPLNKQYETFFRDYQKEAINKWKEKNYIGIFNMATGTGKTLTAIAAMTKLAIDTGKKIFIVICPYMHLVEQWTEDLKDFNFDVIKAHSAEHDWQKNINRKLDDYEFLDSSMCIVTTIDTYKSRYMQSFITVNSREIVIIADEAHNLGATQISQNLNEKVKYRLALSATFDRANDEEGTKALYDYFKNICINYSLEEAISNGMLTPYYYHPIVTNLTDDELDKYNVLSSEIAKNTIEKNGKLNLTEYGKMLTIKRARLVAGATNKVIELLDRIQYIEDKNNILIYCGATTIGDINYNENYKDEEVSEDFRQIDFIIKNIREKYHLRIAPFTATETLSERKNIIKAFERKELNIITAIKCLDEGVNIPSIDKAFILASCTNPREYIQRKGRVLRKYPNKLHADIYDFITLPRSIDSARNQSSYILDGDISLIKKEISRMQDFAKSSIDPSESDEIINDLNNIYGDLLNKKEKLENE